MLGELAVGLKLILKSKCCFRTSASCIQVKRLSTNRAGHTAANSSSVTRKKALFFFFLRSQVSHRWAFALRHNFASASQTFLQGARDACVRRLRLAPLHGGDVRGRGVSNQQRQPTIQSSSGHLGAHCGGPVERAATSTGRTCQARRRWRRVVHVLLHP